MEEIINQEEKKRKKKTKLILLVLISIILILVFVGAYFGYLNYKVQITEEIQQEVQKQLANQYGENITSVEVNSSMPDPDIKNPLTNVNPRRSYLNSSRDEVAYIDHLGNIGGISNVIFNNTNKGYGFFKYLGNQVKRITKIWATDIDSTRVNATNITTKKIKSADWTNITGLIDSQISDTLTIDGTGTVTWAALTTYPTACNSSAYISAFGDTLTCAGILISDTRVTDAGKFLLATGDTATGNYTFDSPTFHIGSTANRVGIGTITPKNTLNVIGDINLTTNLVMGASTISATDIAIIDDSIIALLTETSGNYVGRATANTTQGIIITGTLGENYTSTIGIRYSTTFLKWGNLTGYPTACATNKTITTMGDTITCTDISIKESQISNLQSYYLKSNPAKYWNATFALFNKTYADTLYSTKAEPLWSGNRTSLYLKSNPFGFYNSSTLTEHDPKWSANRTSYYTKALDPWSANRTSYYTKTQVDNNFTTRYVPYTGATTNVNLGVHNLTINTNTLFVNTNGRVGIGTTSPNTLLEINSSSNPTLRITEGSTTSYLQIRDVSVNEADIIKYTSTGVVIFDIDAVPSDRTNSSLIRMFRNTNTSGIVGLAILRGNGGTSNNAFISGNGNSYFSRYTGNVGIGTASPTAKLSVSGNLTVSILQATSATTVCRDANNALSTCSSSLRYKENISEINIGLETVLKMKPRQFIWKSTGEHFVGFIAEEVEPIDKRLVFYNNNVNTSSYGLVEGVNYELYTAVLTKAIQEQQNQIVLLNKIVQNLTQINFVLQSQINDIKIELCKNNPTYLWC